MPGYLWAGIQVGNHLKFGFDLIMQGFRLRTKRGSGQGSAFEGGHEIYALRPTLLKANYSKKNTETPFFRGIQGVGMACARGRHLRGGTLFSRLPPSNFHVSGSPELAIEKMTNKSIISFEFQINRKFRIVIGLH